MRVIVTGSRDWPFATEVHDALEGALKSYPGRRLHLMHGACPTGTDAFAEEWFQAMRILRDRHLTREKFPADWTAHGRAAGPRRNAEMIAAGADLVLAFQRNGSRGTQNAIDLARKAGIEVRIWSHPEEGV